jgi:hypothetical protein
MFIDAAALRLGLGAVQMMIASLLVIWWLLLTNLATHVQRLLKLPQIPLLGPIAAALLILATLNAAPAPVQSIYWMVGAGAYFVPLVAFTLYLWLSVQPYLKKRLTLALCFFSAFLIAGTPSAATFTQLALLGVAVLLIKQAPYRQRQIAGLAGGLLGLLIVMIGPGNQARQGFFPPPNFGWAFGQTLTNAGTTLSNALERAPFSTLALIVLPLLLAYFFDERRVTRRAATGYILLIPALIYLLQCITFGLGYYLVSALVPGRVWTIPEYAMGCLLAVWGYVIGLALRTSPWQLFKVTPRTLRVVAVVIGLWLLAAAAASGVNALGVTRSLQQYAELWDKRDAQLQAQAGATQFVRTTSFHGWFGLEDLLSDNKHWVNGCASRYYQVPGFVIGEWIRMP